MNLAEQMKPENWTVSSNEALKLSLVDDHGAAQFSPTFSYPIFGDSEQIFGYQDLQIILAFDSITFKPFLNMKFSKKMDDVDEDPQTKLLKFLPKDDTVIKDEEIWVDAFSRERKSFSLPDDHSKVTNYTQEGSEFAIYKVSLSDQKIKQLHRRMQIFTLFFIESASFIDENDASWELFLTFNVTTKQCVGYSTVYKYWKYPGARIFDDAGSTSESRKISQFLIFPTYQGKKHGAALYNAMVDFWLKDDRIKDITVEDPNESFDALRDRNDFKRLYNDRLHEEIPNELPISEEWISAKRQHYKIERRQFMRLLEMILLLNSSPNFRLQVKKRLYEKNYDILSDLDISARNDKLQEAFLSIKEEYEMILASLSLKRHGSFDDNLITKRR